MKSYTVISKEIKDYRHGKNKNTDIYLFSYLKLCSNYKPGKCNATQIKIQKLIKISLRTIQSSIARLRETELMSVQTRFEGIKRLNTYVFNTDPKNYFFVDNTFYYTEITNKEKGLLLLIKSLCLNNTNKTLYSCSKISNELGQNRKTVSKMIYSLIEKIMLLKLKNGYLLAANYFPLYFTGDKYEEFVYQSILEFCQSKNVKLFAPDIHPIKLIIARYPYKENDFSNAVKESLKSYYLPQILKDRCPTLTNKIESLNYFLDVLNIEYVKRDFDLNEYQIEL